jgi:hypothetical protein
VAVQKPAAVQSLRQCRSLRRYRAYGSAEACGGADACGSAEAYGSAEAFGSAKACGSAETLKQVANDVRIYLSLNQVHSKFVSFFGTRMDANRHELTQICFASETIRAIDVLQLFVFIRVHSWIKKMSERSERILSKIKWIN